MESPLESDRINSNTKLIYEYTENSLKLLNDSINVLNTKLSAVIAFSGLLLKFSSDLPDQSLVINCSITDALLNCYSCLLLKILIGVLVIASIGVSLVGYSPQGGGEIVPPEYLLENWRYEPEEEYREALIKFWGKSIAQLVSMRDKKAHRLKRAIWLVGAATAISALDIILASTLVSSC